MNERIDYHAVEEPQITTKWLSGIFGVLLASLVILLGWTRHHQTNFDYQQIIDTETINLASYIEIDITNRLTSFQRMVDRWEVRGGTPKNEFDHDATNHLIDLPGIQAIEWVDKDYYIRWIVPLTGNEQAQGLYLASEESRKRALEQARSSKNPTMTPPVNLVQGGLGLLIYFPVFTDNVFDGFILVVFRIEEWLDKVFSFRETQQQREMFKVALTFDDTLIYQQKGWIDAPTDDFDAVQLMEILGHNFSIRCRPTAMFFEQHRSWSNEIMTISGLFFAALASYVLNLFYKSNREAWRAYSANRSLEITNRKLEKTSDELHNTYSRLELATKAGNIGVWVWDIPADTLSWNEMMHQLYDIPTYAKPTYAIWISAIHQDDRKATELLLQKALAGKALFDTDFKIVPSNGIEREIRAAARVERDEEGQPIRVTGVNWDITETKRSKEILATERRRLSDILEGTNAGTWEWNVQTGEVVFNERWAEIIGYTLKELEPISIDTWKKHAHPDDVEESGALLEKHFRGELNYYEYEARLKHKDGSWIWVLDRGKVSSWTDDGKPLLMSGTHQDITERKQTEERISHLANHDPLTDLPSLRLAEDRTNMAIQIAKRKKTLSALMFIDLDGFKTINDNYGHDAGDALLRQMAKRLLTTIRKNDTIARIGGDEFLAIVTELQTKNNGGQIAEKIIEVVSQPFIYKGNIMTVGASIGIAFYPKDGDSFELLIKQADDAMYSVKNSGKNDFAFVGAGFGPENNNTPLDSTTE